MQWQAWFMLGVVAVIFIGLARNWGPPDGLLLGATVLSGLVGILSPKEVFHGFANTSMLTVGALFVVAAALRETGGLDLIGGRILGAARTELSGLLRLAASVLPSSAFLNNTPIVAMFLPVVTDWCRKHRISPSRLLMPLSFLAILGGLCTMIGTSTNLLVNGLMSMWASTHPDPQLVKELAPMGLFELGKAGLPMAVVGLVFLTTIGRRLLPDRKDLLEQWGESSREYLVDMEIKPGCRLIGKTVEQAALRHLPGLFLVEIVRGERVISPVEPDEILETGDRLTFTGAVSTIVDLERIPGLEPAADGHYESDAVLQRDRRLSEAVISATSPVLNKTVRDADFRALYNAAIIAVHRGGTRLQGRIGDIVLRPGDTVLLQTGPHFARAHRSNPDFYLVSGVEEARPVRHDRAVLSVVLLGLLVVGLGVSTYVNIMPEAEVLIAFLAAGLMVTTRCISASDARQSIDWQTLVAIASSIGLGKAIENSGAAAMLAGWFFEGISGLGPVVALSGVYLVTVLVSELLSNNASAALVFPFAIATAQAFGVDARPFAMAVALAASAAFATPIGYQTHLMVWGPGGYRFTDFTRVGVPLDLLLWIAASILIPICWPL